MGNAVDSPAAMIGAVVWVGTTVAISVGTRVEVTVDEFVTVTVGGITVTSGDATKIFSTAVCEGVSV